MNDYAKMPSGLIMPREVATSAMSNMLFGANGAYRSASPRNRNTAGWLTSDGSADVDTLFDLPTLRRQSSDLVRNEPIPAGIIGGYVTSVVGTGVKPQSRIDHEFLKLTEQQADEWQRMAERIFAQVAEKPHWDLERKLNFYQQQATVERAKLERGDLVAIRRYAENKNKVLGLAVQLVEADRIATPLEYQADEKIRAGVELGSDGAPAFYHILQRHPGERLFLNANDKFAKVPAFDADENPVVLHILNRLRPGQTRGVPLLAPVIEPLKQLGRYTEAEITAAVISGMFAVFVESEASVSPMGGAIPGRVNSQPVTPNNSPIQKMQSGMIVDLKPGEKISIAEASRPNTAFEGFITAVFKQIGIGIGLPYEVMMRSYNTSYSAARAAIIDAWNTFLQERQQLVDMFCQPCWEWAIHEAVARGLLAAPGFFDNPLVRQAYLQTEWVGQTMPSIDPLKEAAAATAWNALNVLPLQTISAQNGRDFDRDYKQIVREKKQMDADGLIRPGEVNLAAAEISADNKDNGGNNDQKNGN